jgi:hypothetical protein
MVEAMRPAVVSATPSGDVRGCGSGTPSICECEQTFGRKDLAVRDRDAWSYQPFISSRAANSPCKAPDAPRSAGALDTRGPEPPRCSDYRASSCS